MNVLKRVILNEIGYDIGSYYYRPGDVMLMHILWKCSCRKKISKASRCSAQ